ncbi:MAG: hypothetical protein ACTHMC_16825 [Pseudobacter sp.]|uniref:hypothetical protein n=1 Tax=Pseudobacter sp. TaxID=2045420 RepID=UPI003F7FEF05
MTKLLYVCLAFTLMAFQCNKRNGDAEAERLAGKWKMTEYWYSPAGPLVYAPAPSDNLIVEFGTGGEFSSNAETYPGYAEYTMYHLENDKELYLLKPGLADKMNLMYTVDKDTLRLYGRCIEGCGQKYIRIK